ncbi:MAG: NHL repeat-containing protein [Candidatus Bathyarchaeia archaeon]|jgi:DNA-binding beta-propeller fold protein YncE
MTKRLSTKLKAFILVLIIVFSSMGAFALIQSLEPEKAYVQVWGEVVLDKPLVGAAISVFDQTGTLLLKEENSTYETGAFYLSIPTANRPEGAVPGSIKAEGGTLGNLSFNGTVTLEVPLFDEESYYKLNAITTLTASYHERNPEIDYAKAEDTVAAFLQVPSGKNLSYVIETMEWDNTVFSHSVFMRQAKTVGGFDQFVNALVLEIEAGKVHSMKGEPLYGGEWGDLAAFIGKSVASGAIGAIAGQGVNWIMHSLGYRNPTEKMIEQLKEQMDSMSQTMTQMKRSLTRIEDLQQVTLQRIDDAVKTIGTKIETSYKGLKWEIEYSALKVRSSNIITAISGPKEVISTAFNRLYQYSKLNPSESHEALRSEIAKTVSDVLSVTGGLEPKLMQINDNILGSMDMGLLDLWSTILTIGATDKTQLESLYYSYVERFSYLLSIELTGINVMIDAFHAKFGNDTKLAEDFWMTWQGKLKNQLDLFLRFSERAAASRIDNLTAGEFNNPNLYYKRFENPNIMQRADEFYQQMLSSLKAEQTPLNVITVRVANFPSVTSQNLPANVDLKLLDVATGKTVAPATFELRSDVTVPDWEFNKVKYELACFTFKVPNGTYRVTSQSVNLLREYDRVQNVTWTANSQILSQGFVSYMAKNEGSTVKPHLVSQWVLNNPNNQIDGPWGITVSREGYVYIAEDGWIWNKPYIYKYDGEGNFLFKWGSFGWANGKLVLPRYVTTTPNGDVCVASGRIQLFDGSGKILKEWGKMEQIFSPPHPTYLTIYGYTGIASSSDGYLYVVDSGNFTGKPQILKYDGAGKLILKWGSYGIDDGTFLNPGPIAIDKQGFVYVFDNGRLGGEKYPILQKFTSNGDYVWSKFIRNSKGEPFVCSAMAVDGLHGNIYLVGDDGYYRNVTYIEKLDSEGNLVFEDTKKLEFPMGIALSPDDSSIYVTDRNGVQRYSYYPVTFVSTKW